MDSTISGSFVPYTSVVGDQDRSFNQRQKITTNNLDVHHYGCSVFITKDVVPATNQIYGIRLFVTATVTFHHFDGIAAIGKKREPKVL